MDTMTKGAAISAAGKAYLHLVSARKHLIGERLALVGTYSDVEKAVRDLRAAQHEIGEALRLCRAEEADVGG